MLKVVGRILNIAVWLGLILLVLLLLAVPMTSAAMFKLGYAPSDTVVEWMHRIQSVQLPAMQLFCFGWIFFVGSCFASFLNVVAWRVPRGKSILGSSHCPQCNVKLKFPTTNVPVLGWLKNGGCCSNCDNRIPVRYLIAELVLGSTFLILFAVQTATGGGTIPFRNINHYVGIENVLFAPQADLLVTLVFHLTILSVIFTLAIAATEKFKAPISLLVLGLIAAAGFHCLPPSIGIIDFRFAAWENGIATNQYLKLFENPTDFACAVGLGIVAAGVCFLSIHLATRDNSHGVFVSLLLVGVSFGWQTVLSITVLYFLISFCLRIDTCGKIFLATVLHLYLWRLQSNCQWWPGPASGIQQLACSAAYIAILAGIHRTLMTAAHRSSENETPLDLPTSTGNLE